jgi:hypothetical protein
LKGRPGASPRAVVDENSTATEDGEEVTRARRSATLFAAVTDPQERRAA